MDKSRKVFHRKSGERLNTSNANDSPSTVSFASSSSPSTYKSPLNWSLRGITHKSAMEIQVTTDNSARPTENEHNDSDDGSVSSNSSKIDHNLSLDNLSISLSNLPVDDRTVNSSVVKNTSSKNLTEMRSNIFSPPVKSLGNHELSNKTGDSHALDDTLCVDEQGKRRKRDHSPDTPTILFDAAMLGSGSGQARKKQKTCTQSSVDPARLFVSVPSESVHLYNATRIMTSQGEQNQDQGSLLKSITNDVYFEARQQFAKNFVITIDNPDSSSSVADHWSELEQASNGCLVKKITDSEADGNPNGNASEGLESLCENKSSSMKLTTEERKRFDRTIDLCDVEERPDSAQLVESKTSTSEHQVSSILNAEERKIFNRVIDVCEVEDISDIIVLGEPIASTSKNQKVSQKERQTLHTTIDLSKDDSVLVCDDSVLVCEDSDSSDLVIVEEKMDCERVFEFSATKPSTSSECDVVFVGKKRRTSSQKRAIKKKKRELMEAHELALTEAAKIYSLLGHPVAVDAQLPSSASGKSPLRLNLPPKPAPSTQTSSTRWDQPPKPQQDMNFIPIGNAPHRQQLAVRPYGSGFPPRESAPMWTNNAFGPTGPRPPMWEQQAFGAAGPRAPTWDFGPNGPPEGSPLWARQVFGVNGPPECWNSPGNSAFGNNVYNPSTAPRQTSGLRPVIIDGSNVAMSHGNRQFSSKGIEICINYFLKKGHKVYCFVPLYRRAAYDTLDSHILDKLENQKTLIFTPSRNIDGYNAVPYDDRYIVQCAAEKGGVIVSKDNYRDLLAENPMYADVIKNRLLMFTWVEDMLMFPQDPLGRRGPSLDAMLRF